MGWFPVPKRRRRRKDSESGMVLEERYLFGFPFPSPLSCRILLNSIPEPSILVLRTMFCRHSILKGWTADNSYAIYGVHGAIFSASILRCLFSLPLTCYVKGQRWQQIPPKMAASFLMWLIPGARRVPALDFVQPHRMLPAHTAFDCLSQSLHTVTTCNL